MPEIKKIVIVDDHVVVRNGLKVLIERIGPYTVIEEFDTGELLLSWLDKTNSADLIVLDYSMPGLNGEEVMMALSKTGCTIPVLILTLNEDERTIVRLFRLGAKGYLLKNCSAQTLAKAFEEIFLRGYYHNEFLTLSLRNDTPPARKSERDKILEQLTPKEKMFLKLVCDEREFTYEQMADKMNLSTRQVDACREELFGKFGIKSKTGLVLFVLKHKLIDWLDGNL